MTSEAARQRVIRSISSPEKALQFLRSTVTNDDLPREELLVILCEFCDKFPEDGFTDRRYPTGFPLGSFGSRAPIAEVFLG